MRHEGGEAIDEKGHALGRKSSRGRDHLKPCEVVEVTYSIEKFHLLPPQI